jgi:spore germination cell wall hydrolase CwlJ-like protein
MCLALNIYHEARSEPILGQYGVALVTMNRAGQDRSKVCDVVFKRKQFSWANKGVWRSGNGWILSRRLQPKEKHAWETAVIIAETTLSGRMCDITHGATYYHERSIHPYWASIFTRVKDMGRHVFYASN